jgi:hypothetical protein
VVFDFQPGGFGKFQGGDITSDTADSDKPAIRVTDRDHAQRHDPPASVPVKPDDLAPQNGLSLQNLSRHVAGFFEEVGRDDDIDGAPPHLRSGVSV